MYRRIDKLAKLGTSIISMSGGEPLLHPELDDLIARVRSHGCISGMITNGYLLMPDRIKRLNRAGLEHMQISIDNVKPDDVSKKSLKVLDKKLQMPGGNTPSSTSTSIRWWAAAFTSLRTRCKSAAAPSSWDFTSTVGIIHDHDGQLRPLSEKEREIFLQMKQMGKKNYARLNFFQDNIAHGRENQWKCRSGAATFMCARTGWCITALSSAAFRRFRWRTTRSPIFAASSSPKRAALRGARSPAYTIRLTWISGAPRRPSPPPSSRSPANSCNLGTCGDSRVWSKETRLSPRVPTSRRELHLDIALRHPAVIVDHADRMHAVGERTPC